MGLDMFLTKRTYIGSWEFTEPEERYNITITRGGKPVPPNVIGPNKIDFIVEEAGYWRKANAIHKWFVEHVQEGNDDCKEYYVSYEQLQELLDTVNRVLAASELVKGKIQNGSTIEDGKLVPIIQDGQRIKDPSVAQELLPTQSGFFFGGTDYDQYYIEGLQHTKQVLEEALTDSDSSYYYHSSW